MAQTLLQVVYVSRASKPLDDPDLQELQRTSISNNRASKLTGLLLYREELFMQLLEGPEAGVAQTLERIERDTRHTNLEVLVWRHTTCRYAPAWSMGVIDARCDWVPLDWLDGIVELAAHCQEHQPHPGWHDDLHALLLAFAGDAKITA